MRQFLLLTAICLSAQLYAQQSISAYVKASTYPIHSIHISDGDMADLEVIGEAIGEARVVSLGEQDHGDAPTFLAKARLVKYLHEKKGFNVIAFESDFYSLVRAMDEVKRTGKSPEDAMLRNIFGVWSETVECLDVFRYIDSMSKTSSPLHVTGFDSQLHGAFRVKNYSKEMSALLSQTGSRFADAIAPLFNYVQRYYPLYAGRVISFDSLVYFDRIADSINQELKSLPDSSFIKILMKSLKAYTSQHIYSAQGDYNTLIVRDLQMAEDLLWLYRYRYAGQKIIIWSHNYHAGKNMYDAFPLKKYGKHISMGNELAKVLKDTMYVLGFSSYNGRAGRIYLKQFKVPKPKKQSLENWMAAKDPAYAFVDLKKFRESNPGDSSLFFMKGKYHKNAKAIWAQVFDGVFYIRDMYPAKRR